VARRLQLDEDDVEARRVEQQPALLVRRRPADLVVPRGAEDLGDQLRRGGVAVDDEDVQQAATPDNLDDA